MRAGKMDKKFQCALNYKFSYSIDKDMVYSTKFGFLPKEIASMLESITGTEIKQFSSMHLDEVVSNQTPVGDVATAQTRKLTSAAEKEFQKRLQWNRSLNVFQIKISVSQISQKKS
jgi:hypothetical protein